MRAATRVFVAVAFFAPLATAAFAFDGPLSAAQISKALFGLEFVGEYPNGRSWTERFNMDGTSNYVEEGVYSNGNMKIEGRRICFTYNEQALNGGCFEVWRARHVGRRCPRFRDPART